MRHVEKNVYASAFVPELDVLCHHFPSGHCVYLYHALGKGFFREHGICASFTRTNHSPKVIAGLAQDIHKIGTATAAEVILATARFASSGADPKRFPVKILYQADQNYTSAFYSLTDRCRQELGLERCGKDIASPQDLIGKVVRLGGGTPAVLFDLLVRRCGLAGLVNPSVEKYGRLADKINLSQIEEFSVKDYCRMLIEGRLDAYSKPTFGHGQFLGRAKTTDPGLRYTAFSTRDLGLPGIYGVGIVGRMDFVEEHPEWVKGFLRAVDKAMKECVGDPWFGVQVMNEMRGLGPEYDAIERIKAEIVVGKRPEITGAGGFFASRDTEKYGYGCIRTERLQALIDMLDEAGLLAARIRPSDVFLELEWRS